MSTGMISKCVGNNRTAHQGKKGRFALEASSRAPGKEERTRQMKHKKNLKRMLLDDLGGVETNLAGIGIDTPPPPHSPN